MLPEVLVQINFYWVVVATMRAAYVREFGGPDVLSVTRDAQIPRVAADHVLIKVHATALNRLDAMLRSGKYSAILPTDGSYLIPGVECSGVVHEVGLGAESEFK